MKRTRVAVIGGGNFGETHLQHFASMPQVEIAGVYDVEFKKAERLCACHGGRAFRSLAEVWDDRSIDLVSIVTPEAEHAEIFAQAAQAEKAIYLEKPLATTLADTRRIVKAAANVIASGGHLLRFAPAYARLKAEATHQGDLRHVNLRRYRSMTQKQIFQRSHLAFVLMTHDFDLANWFVEVPFRRLVAREASYGGQVAADQLTVMIEYENGSTATLEAGWMLPEAVGIEVADWCSVAFAHGLFELRIPGQDFFAYTTNGIHPQNTVYAAAAHGRQYGPLRAALDYLVECVAAGVQPQINTIAQAAEAVVMAEAAVRSVRENRFISREELDADH